jgi:prefoldin subunit 5
MDIEEIQETIETIQRLDDRRREAFRREYRESDDGRGPYPETRELIGEQREALDRLDELLATEREQLEELVDYTEFLTVDQAVRHRDRAVSMLRERQEHLGTFHDAMTAALDAIESNVDALETEGEDAVEADPAPHLDDAQEALEAHNEAVEDLQHSMEILNAYLM